MVMVSSLTTDGSGTTENSTSSVGEFTTSHKDTSQNGQNDSGCFQDLREKLYSKGLSKQATELILASWRTGTKKQYNSYLSKWMRFCCSREIDPFNPTITCVISFLTELYQKGLGCSGINTAKSDISSIVFIVNNVQIGNHIMIKQFLKGVYNEKPTLPRYNCTWDVSVVLRYISDNLSKSTVEGTPSLKDLSLKLVMLLALTTGQRLQTLHSICVHNIDINCEYVKIRIGELLKTRSQTKHPSELYIEKYPNNENVCVVKTLLQYLDTTKTLCETESQLFISYQKPYKSVAKGTLGKWIKAVLSGAGIDMNIFKLHSTRSASTSVASAKIPVETVLRTAGWKTDCTFRKFYKRNITNNSDFARSVLEKTK